MGGCPGEVMMEGEETEGRDEARQASDFKNKHHLIILLLVSSLHCPVLLVKRSVHLLP